MKMHLVTALALALALPVPAFAQATNDSGGAARADPQPEAEAFARTAAISGQFEIETSKLALQQAKDPAVKAFAETMIADHTKAGEELARIAGVMPLPTELDPPHADLLKTLQASGADFDRVYVAQQVDAHREAVALFTSFSTIGPNGAFRAFAAKTLPVLQMHQEMAGQLVETVK